ncbi:Tn3 family transposase [Actinopolyspora saharensis]|uniref:Tn3 family transposase n=1 Tax=Actinopolyspora saharensis TaxID=995062 RepID=UPI003F66C65C
MAEQRRQAQQQLHARLSQAVTAADPELPGRLSALLVVPEGSRISELERSRRGPTRTSGRSLTQALDRASELAGLGAQAVDVSAVPANRLEALARDGLAAKAQTLARREPQHQTATLVAVVRSLTVTAVDEALDVFTGLMADKLIKAAERTSRQAKLASLPRLRKASARLAAVARVLQQTRSASDLAEGYTAQWDLEQVWAAIEQVVEPNKLDAAVDTVAELAPPQADDDAAWRADLVGRWNVVRPFLPLLATALPLGATPTGRSVLDAVRALPELIGRQKVREAEIYAEVVTGSWRPLVYDGADLDLGCADKHAYVMCVLEALYKALRHREVYAVGSKRWGDPRAQLLDGPSWDQLRPQVLTGLQLPEQAQQHLDEQASTLDTAWRDLGARLAATEGQGPVRLDSGRDGRARLRLDALDKLDEPDSLAALRECTAAMLPPVDLPELLLEIHAHTGFLSEFTHASGGQARMADAEISLAAVLVASATNVGYAPVARENHTALSRSRLSHTEQNYLRAETLKAANARLIEAQADIGLAQAWGGGQVASVDGLRFVVPTQSVHTGYNPRYFGRKRGATWLNAINDQVAGIGATVVPGTQRDSLHQLDVLLNPDHGRRPELVTSDTAGYSDLVFGLYRLCGMTYAPRLANLADTRFWRLDPAADYGPANELARHQVKPEHITRHWPEMLRVAGSLVTGTVRAFDLIRALGRDGNPTPLGRAVIEYGRLAKTHHLLAVADPTDDTYRRSLNAQLNTTESRHRLARAICFGDRGQLRQTYQEGMEDQLGALGLVLNAVVLWNTTYLDAAVNELRAQGYEVRDADVVRLSPLLDAHLNVHGTYTFQQLQLTGLRPLRDPSVPDGDESSRSRG